MLESFRELMDFARSHKKVLCAALILAVLAVCVFMAMTRTKFGYTYTLF